MQNPDDQKPAAPAFNAAAGKIIRIQELTDKIKELHKKEIGAVTRGVAMTLRILAFPVRLPLSIVKTFKTSFKSSFKGTKADPTMYVSKDYLKKVESNPLLARKVMAEVYLSEDIIREQAKNPDLDAIGALIAKFSGVAKKRDGLMERAIQEVADHRSDMEAGNIVLFDVKKLWK